MDEVYAPGTALDIPHRPQWSYSMSKKELETLEEKEFEAYLKEIHSKYTVSQLSYFENNLEVRVGGGAGGSGWREGSFNILCVDLEAAMASVRDVRCRSPHHRCSAPGKDPPTFQASHMTSPPPICVYRYSTSLLHFMTML